MAGWSSHHAVCSFRVPQLSAKMNFLVDWSLMNHETPGSQHWQSSCWGGYVWTPSCLGRVTWSCKRARLKADARVIPTQKILCSMTQPGPALLQYVLVTSPGSCDPDVIPITSPTSCNSSAKWLKTGNTEETWRKKKKEQISGFSHP